MAARKSRLFWNSFLPVNHTHDEVVKKIFSPGRFACTITGNLQLVGIVSLCTNLAIIIVSDYCPLHPCNRKLNIGTAIATISCASALYFIFCCGYVANNPSLWVRISILTNLILPITTIVSQSMAMKVCLTDSKIHKSPGPIAIVGGGCLLLSCFCLFVLYRYRELDVEINVLKERNVSEDRTAAAANAITHTQRNVAFSTISDDDRNHNHIPGSIYVKYEGDRRKCSVHSNQSNCFEYHGNHGSHGGHAPERKTSVYGRHEEHGHGHSHSHSANHSHNHQKPTHGYYGHHNGNCAVQCKRKVSNDVGGHGVAVHNNAYRHDDDYPHCFKGRRKNSLYAKHM